MLDWFSRTAVDADTTMLTEPFVHDFVRANIWHLRGGDVDLLVDTGMGIRPLAPEIDTPAGKPLLVVATHIHLDHVGSLHEFPLRAGPRHSAAYFDSMDEAVTYAHMFHGLDGAVSKLPAPGWKAADYKIPPAPLTRTLDDGDLIDLGDRQFRVLHLPGHSPDSIALFDEAGGLFFAGDATMTPC
jgi:glyoxylase-like metal-dependent hydrolase (beta-lactamase superfamily II)